MKTDALFCKGEVKILMERRRQHSECGSRGCEVVVGEGCEASERRARKMGRMGIGMRRGRFECMGILIDPRLVYLAVLMVLFSFLVNVLVGMRLCHMWRGDQWWRT